MSSTCTRRSTSGTRARNSMKTKILVVDDEPDALEVLGFKLREAGYTPIFAKDGTRAIAIARDERPDLIVLDLMLPEVDGLEVCKILRRDASTASIPVIMLTARAAEMDRVLGLELGADDYVTKPFSPRELVIRIRKQLSRSRSGDEPGSHLRIDENPIDSRTVDTHMRRLREKLGTSAQHLETVRGVGYRFAAAE